MIRSHSSSREHEREAVYHHAAVGAVEETRPLAERMEPLIAALKAARRAREDTEDATVRALALRNTAAATLGDGLRAVWAEADIADRERPMHNLVVRLFPDHTAAQIREMPLEDQLREAAKILERLTLLAEDDPMRPHLERLGARSAGLQAARAAHDEAIRSVAAARVREDLAQLDVRRALGANRGALIEANHGSARMAAQYFRGEPRRRNGKAKGAVAAVPLAVMAPHSLQSAG